MLDKDQGACNQADAESFIKLECTASASGQQTWKEVTV